MKKRKIPWNKIDNSLNRLSHISQVLLVALAIFGFFYTVLPIYNNQLLNEENSKLTLEGEGLKDSIEIFENNLDSIKIKYDSLNTSLQLTQNDLESKISGLELSLIDKNSRIRTAEETLFNLQLKSFFEEVSFNFPAYRLDNDINVYAKNSKGIKKLLKDLINNLKTDLEKGYETYFMDRYEIAIKTVKQNKSGKIPDSLLNLFSLESLKLLKQHKSKILKNVELYNLLPKFSIAEKYFCDAEEREILDEMTQVRNEIPALEKLKNSIPEFNQKKDSLLAKLDMLRDKTECLYVERTLINGILSELTKIYEKVDMNLKKILFENIYFNRYYKN